MDTTKHIDFFNPQKVKEEVHVIGAGAIGSNLSEQLVRLGFEKIHLYDFDTIESRNITNQTYKEKDIDKKKIEALAEHLKEINSEVELHLHSKGWQPDTPLEGYVFTTVDSIELRKEIYEENEMNMAVKLFTDLRIGLSEGQMYSTKPGDFTRILSTMNFKDDEVTVPVSACGTQMTVLPTIQAIVSMGVMNLIDFIKTGKFYYQTVIDVRLGAARSY